MLVTLARQQLSGSPTPPGPKIWKAAAAEQHRRASEMALTREPARPPQKPLLDARGRAHEWDTGHPLKWERSAAAAAPLSPVPVQVHRAIFVAASEHAPPQQPPPPC